MASVSREDYLAAIQRIAESVYDFHERWDQPLGVGMDGAVPCLTKRLSLHMEEVGEMARAVHQNDAGNAVIEAADELYVALGTVLALGVLAPVHAVATKNNAKTHETHMVGPTGKIVRRPQEAR